MRVELVTAPQQVPVSLQEAKAQLRLEDDNTGDDALIAGLIRSAIELAERHTGRVFITQVWRMFLDHWPGKPSEVWWEGVREGPSTMLDPSPAEVSLPKVPLISVDHVKTYDDNDAATTWATTNYFVDSASEPGRIVPRTGVPWPTTTRTANGIEIQFTAGYGGNPHDVPEGIRLGILEMVSKLYDGCAADEAAKGRPEALLQPYRLMRL